MSFRSISVLIVLIASVLFVMVNWGAIMTPMPLSFILFTVNMPLGLVLIAGGSLVFLVSLLWMLWKQAGTLVDLQKANREARQARSAATDAEDSRVAKFEENLQGKFDALEKHLVDRMNKALEERSKTDDLLKGDITRALKSMQKSLDETTKALKELEEQTNQRLI